MDKSILIETKKVLGVHEEAGEFDIDIIMHINSAFFMLNQGGIGPEDGFSIQGPTETWSEFIGPRSDLQIVKSFVFVFVRLLFDRPPTSYGVQALERQRDEMLWRLEIQRQRSPNG